LAMQIVTPHDGWVTAWLALRCFASDAFRNLRAERPHQGINIFSWNRKKLFNEPLLEPYFSFFCLRRNENENGIVRVKIDKATTNFAKKSKKMSFNNQLFHSSKNG